MISPPAKSSHAKGIPTEKNLALPGTADQTRTPLGNNSYWAWGASAASRFVHSCSVRSQHVARHPLNQFSLRRCDRTARDMLPPERHLILPAHAHVNLWSLCAHLLWLVRIHALMVAARRNGLPTSAVAQSSV